MHARTLWSGKSILLVAQAAALEHKDMRRWLEGLEFDLDQVWCLAMYNHRHVIAFLACEVIRFVGAPKWVLWLREQVYSATLELTQMYEPSRLEGKKEEIGQWLSRLKHVAG